MKYPKSSLRSMNELIKGNYTVEKFKQEAEQNLIDFKNEDIKMQKIREEPRHLQINRDYLSISLKDQNSQTINLTDFENNTLIYVYALKQINTQYGPNYTTIGSLSDELNEQFNFFSILV